MAPPASGISCEVVRDGAIVQDMAAVAPQAPPCAQHENNEASERLSLVESEKLKIEKVSQHCCLFVILFLANNFVTYTLCIILGNLHRIYMFLMKLCRNCSLIIQ